jgi:arginine-tRNA-protein transferase
VQQRARFDEAHYQLYCRYIEARHPDGGMASPTENQYRDFLISHWCDTRFVEFHLEERLLAIAVTDRLPHGLSALYTFFDPDASELSPGVYAILWQISEAARLTLPWLYLGYWIPECKKMRYKAQYRPLQLLRNGSWHEYGPDGNIP